MEKLRRVKLIRNKIKPLSFFDLLVKYSVAAIIIAVPLYPKFPFINVPGTFVAIRLEDLLIAFSAVIVFAFVIGNLNNFIKNKLNKTVLIFLFSGLISVISALFVTQTISAPIGLLHWLRRVEYMIPLYLGILAIKSDRKNLGFFINISLIVLGFVFIYGWGQKHYSWPVIITQNEEYSKGIALRYVSGGHINSTFAGHYDLGTYLVLILPVFITYFFLLKSRVQKIFYLSVIFMGLWLMANTASRISLFSFLISASISMILVKKIKAIPVIIITTLIFASSSNNLVSRYQRIFEVINNKIIQFNLINYVNQPVMAQDGKSILPKRKVEKLPPTPIPVFEDRSSNIRLNVEWPRALRALAKNPLLGTGYSSITLATDNDYLRLLGETGIIGFVAFIALLIRIIILLLSKYPFVKNYNGNELAFIAGIAASIPGILTNAIFIDVFEASKFAILFWLFIGMAVSLTKYEDIV